MPHKANAARRHHIPRAQRTVTNWAEYDAALHQRGSLTVWFSEEAIEGWKAARRVPVGAAPDRRVDRSVLQLLGLELPVPDHSTIARRARTVTLPSPPRSSGGPLHLLVDSTGQKLCGPGE